MNYIAAIARFYRLTTIVVWLALIFSVGCVRTKPEPIAIQALRQKASRHGLKWQVFYGSNARYLAYATDGPIDLQDCRDYWSTEGDTAEHAAIKLMTLIDGPRNQSGRDECKKGESYVGD